MWKQNMEYIYAHSVHLLFPILVVNISHGDIQYVTNNIGILTIPCVGRRKFMELTKHFFL